MECIRQHRLNKLFILFTVFFIAGMLSMDTYADTNVIQDTGVVSNVTYWGQTVNLLYSGDTVIFKNQNPKQSRTIAHLHNYISAILYHQLN